MRQKMITALCFVLCSLVSAVAQIEPPDQARLAVAAGVTAYKNADYEGAAQNFRNALRLNPDLVTARLYLATTLAQQYVPGVNETRNIKLADDAIEQYAEILKQQPDDVRSMKGIAYLSVQLKRWPDARQYYKRALQIEPNDPELYYSLGVVAWTEAYQAVMNEKLKMRLRSEDTLIFKPVCRELREKELAAVEEGMDMLTKAISLRENYDDAMAYQGLLYRIHADLQCGNPEASKADRSKADEWTNLAMAAKKKRDPGGWRKVPL